MWGLVFKEDGFPFTAAWLVSKLPYASSGRPACHGDAVLTHGHGGRGHRERRALSLLGFMDLLLQASERETTFYYICEGSSFLEGTLMQFGLNCTFGGNYRIGTWPRA